MASFNPCGDGLSKIRNTQGLVRKSDAYQDYFELYSQSKVAMWFIQSEFARRQARLESSILFIAGNPGTYNTNMWQYTPKILKWLMWPITRDLSHAADTHLWMGFSDSVTMDDTISGLQFQVVMRYVMADDILGNEPISSFPFAKSKRVEQEELLNFMTGART